MNQAIIWVSTLGVLISCRSGKVEMESQSIDSGNVGSGPSTDTDDSGGSNNDTGVDPLPSLDISRERMLVHLDALMDIAVEHGGHRSAGSPGYDASVDYVKSQLEVAGYTTRSAVFDIERDVWNQAPAVFVETEEPLEYEEDFYVMSGTGSGSVTAPLTGVDLVIPAPSGGGMVTSGCESSDFEGFTPGHVALIQRGSCTFQEKTSHAVAAGAAAVLIFNEGTPGNRDLFGGTLDSEVENPVPVYSLSYAVGEALAALDADATISVVADFERVSIPTQNVFAETGGDPSRVVVVGAHLDSVEAGPGINDNGSGVALILEAAVQLAEQEVALGNQIRFAFWGGEELGLLGSIDYVFGISESERSSILANLNFDMVASPNPARMIYDGDGSTFGEPGPPGSPEIEQIFASWFDANGLAYRETPFDGRSDYGPFIWTGIPAGGLFTGAEQVKSGAEVEVFGGEAGLAYDECYHQNCDTIENLDLDVLDEMAGAAAKAIIELGQYGGSMGSSKIFGLPSHTDPPRLPDWLPTACAAHERIWRR